MQYRTDSDPVLRDETMRETTRRAGRIAANVAAVVLGKEDVIQA